MKTGNYDLEIPQGAKFKRTFVWKQDGEEVDLTGYTAKMQIRSLYGKELIDEFTDGAGITLSGGSIELLIPGTTTKDYEFDQAVWDLELVPATGADDTERLLQGTARLIPEVTL